MTRKTALEKQIADLSSRGVGQFTLSDLLLLECLEKMQAERRAKKPGREPRSQRPAVAKQSDR